MAKAESCFHCVYSHCDLNQAMWLMSVGVASRPTCGNQPDYPGRMRECPLGPVCRNFRPRPPSPNGETVRTIPLGDGFYAYIDAADYEWLTQWKWHMQNGYAVRYEKKKLIFMHRQIARPPEGKIVDHKNRNRLDNTRDNLRICTHQENTQNANKIQGTFSRFKGVSYRKERDKYFAQIYCHGEQFYLGLFEDEIEAARAYDRRAVELFGEFARLNFPEEWPPERRAEVREMRHAGSVERKRKGKTAKKRKSDAKQTKASNRRTHNPKRTTRPARPPAEGRTEGEKIRR